MPWLPSARHEPVIPAFNNPMPLLAKLGSLAGLILLLALFLWQGTMETLQLLFDSGWGLLWLPLIWLPCMVPATQGWRLLFGEHKPPGFIPALTAMWIGRAVNNLLPVASIGGEIVKARLVHIWGTDGISAAASVMVDKVSQALALAVWGLIGVCLLFTLSADSMLAVYAGLGFCLLAFCTLLFILVQKLGMLGFLAKFGGRFVKADAWDGISFNAGEIDQRIRTIYRTRRKLVFAVCLRTLGLIMQTGEIWFACLLLNHPVGLTEALMLKSLTSTLSEIAFVIPNGYGIQEGAFILIGAIIGIPADVAFVLSLTIRIRDFILDPAGLIALHHIEHARLDKKLQQQIPD
jgi:putative membrane protein